MEKSNNVAPKWKKAIKILQDNPANIFGVYEDHFEVGCNFDSFDVYKWNWKEQKWDKWNVVLRKEIEENSNQITIYEIIERNSVV